VGALKSRVCPYYSGEQVYMRTAFLLLGTLIVVVLGWGYWHASTHGTLDVSVNDISLKNDRQSYGRVLSADLIFTDTTGTILAKGRAEKPLGIVSIPHPEIGDCRREEREGGLTAWQQCFETQSRWFVTWVRRVRYASVTLRNCRIDHVPVSIDETKYDWWLWWVPAREIGGAPYTYFKLTLWVDSDTCRPANR
jgi:hypothetical protein